MARAPCPAGQNIIRAQTALAAPQRFWRGAIAERRVAPRPANPVAKRRHGSVTFLPQPVSDTITGVDSDLLIPWFVGKTARVRLSGASRLSSPTRRPNPSPNVVTEV